jgi:hypothetical protein
MGGKKLAENHEIIATGEGAHQEEIRKRKASGLPGSVQGT